MILVTIQHWMLGLAIFRFVGIEKGFNATRGQYAPVIHAKHPTPTF
jgi:hypothetical protein